MRTNRTKVIIAGSRQLSRLNDDVTRRIDTMIEKGFTILVGGANLADKAVQGYLAEKGYRDVIAHCLAANCRNNVGGWSTREVAAPKGRAVSPTTRRRTRQWLTTPRTVSCCGTARARER